jgi:hypothetical protein
LPTRLAVLVLKRKHQIPRSAAAVVSDDLPFHVGERWTIAVTLSKIARSAYRQLTVPWLNVCGLESPANMLEKAPLDT